MNRESQAGPIGILGGTFDPIHLGHLHIAKEALKRVPLKEIRFLPSYNPLLRVQPVASAKDRTAMVRLAIEGEERFRVDDREIRRKGRSYMLDTLQSIRGDEGDEVSLCLILALDTFSHFHYWYHWEGILGLAHLILVGRPGYTLPDEGALREFFDRYRTDCVEDVIQASHGHLLDLVEAIPSIDISATEIRRALLSCERPTSDLPSTVLDYIIEHKLYT